VNIVARADGNVRVDNVQYERFDENEFLHDVTPRIGAAPQ
jgi:hypothetical protein